LLDLRKKRGGGGKGNRGKNKKGRKKRKGIAAHYFVV